MATNTRKSISNSTKSDAELSAKAMQEVNKHRGDRVPFKCEIAYAALYPNGFESTCQGLHIFLIFDGRTVELPAFMAKYVKEKIEKKALSLIDKKTRNTKKTQQYLGMEIVG